MAKSSKEHRYNSRVQLKKGMLVVLLSNLDIAAGLVNGSQGTIQKFVAFDQVPVPQAARKGRDADATDGPTLTGEHAKYCEARIKHFMSDSETKEWPVVRFLNGQERTMYADCTVNQLGDEEPYCLISRTQIPLMAGYAITTHKSQVRCL